MSVTDFDVDRPSATVPKLIAVALCVIVAVVDGVGVGADTDAVLTGELLEARADHSAADALLAGVIAAGEMSYEETAHFTYLTASYRDTLEPVSAVLQPEVRERTRR